MSRNIQRFSQARQLREAVERGEIQPPVIDLNDLGAIAKLSPDQLKLVSAGLYRQVDVVPGVIPDKLPDGWDLGAVRELQRQHPQDWQHILRQLT